MAEGVAPATRSVRVLCGDVSIAARSFGDASLPTVVLVHGFPDNSTVWDPVVRALAADYHVVTYDVRGAGQSDAPEKTEDYRLDKLASDLRAVTSELCPDKPFHLVAHDWGSIQHWESVTDPEFQSRIASYTTISGPCLDHAGFSLRKVLRPTPRNLGQFFVKVAASWYIYLFHLPWLAPFLWKHFFWKRFPAMLKLVEGVEVEQTPTRMKDGYHAIKLYRANIFPRLFAPRKRRTAVYVQAIVPLRDRYVMPSYTDDLPQWAPRLWRRDVDETHWSLLLAKPGLLASYISEFVKFVETGWEPTALKDARVAAPAPSSAGYM